MINNIIHQLDSGRVRRWHSNPDMVDCGENNAEHQWRVAVFLLWIEPNASRHLLIAALTHDTGELMVGDLPKPVKEAHPEMYKMHEAVERSQRLRITSFAQHLSQREIRILKLCDALAALEQMALHAPGLRKTKEWGKAVLRAQDETVELSNTVDVTMFKAYWSYRIEHQIGLMS